MKKGFLYLLLASCLLCSCDNKKLDNYDITPIKEQDLVVYDVYEAVNKLHTLKNYTINIKIESDTENTEYYNIYAEKYHTGNIWCGKRQVSCCNRPECSGSKCRKESSIY